jgi:hypothetical protein
VAHLATLGMCRVCDNSLGADQVGGKHPRKLLASARTVRMLVLLKGIDYGHSPSTFSFVRCVGSRLLIRDRSVPTYDACFWFELSNSIVGSAHSSCLVLASTHYVPLRFATSIMYGSISTTACAPVLHVSS